MNQATQFPNLVPLTMALLVVARARITEEGHWTQNAFARRADGSPTWAGDMNATCFCAVGAVEQAKADMVAKGLASVYAIAHSYAGRYLQSALNALKTEDFVHLPEYNDDPSTTHADILKLFDTAIAKAKADILQEQANSTAFVA